MLTTDLMKTNNKKNYDVNWLPLKSQKMIIFV